MPGAYVGYHPHHPEALDARGLQVGVEFTAHDRAQPEVIIAKGRITQAPQHTTHAGLTGARAVFLLMGEAQEATAAAAEPEEVDLIKYGVVPDATGRWSGAFLLRVVSNSSELAATA